MSPEPIITPEFEDVVVGASERIIQLLKLAETTEAVRDELLGDMHSLASDSGRYRVTSKGRCVWEGTTLMGALTAQVTGRYDRPVRVWQVHPGGKRQLLLIDTYYREAS